MENTPNNPEEGNPPKRARFNYQIESDSENDPLLQTDPESTTSYDSEEGLPNPVFEEEFNLPLPPLPPEDSNSTTTQFGIFNQTHNVNKQQENKELKKPQTNASHDLIKTLGLISGLGLAALAGIGYGLSLVMPQLHSILATLSIVQIGALFLGMEFLIISAALMAVNYINTKNESNELNNLHPSNPSS